jgi:hypothetical protein
MHGISYICAKSIFVSPGTTYNAAVQSGRADETSTARDLLQKQVPRTKCSFGLTQKRTMIVKIVEV